MVLLHVVATACRDVGGEHSADSNREDAEVKGRVIILRVIRSMYCSNRLELELELEIDRPLG